MPITVTQTKKGSLHQYNSFKNKRKKKLTAVMYLNRDKREFLKTQIFNTSETIWSINLFHRN